MGRQEVWIVNNLVWNLRYLAIIAILVSSQSMVSKARSLHDKKVISSVEAEDYNFWRQHGFEDLNEAIQSQSKSQNTNMAKNVILFIGDGMSNPTLTAARIFKARENDMSYPEREYLTLEKLPHMGRIKTYNVNQQTPDSASTASAIFSGIKTIHHTLGYDSSILFDDATSMSYAKQVDNILHWAQSAGMGTGFVTTTRVTHATPAALYGHISNRDWECIIPKDVDNPSGVKDLAWQLVNTSPGNKTNVIFGGGHPAFIPRPSYLPQPIGNPSAKEDYGSTDWNCYRNDGLNLIQKWQEQRTKSQFIRTLSELNNVNPAEVDYLFGLFADYHLPFEDERDKEKTPSLQDMTKKAIEILQNHKNGFFLLVEGGRIDHSHHNSWANRALTETVAFDVAIEAALDMVDTKETLLIVTADHSHSMSMSGYSPRGADVRGLGEDMDDGLPATILNYANGPGFYEHLVVNSNGDNVSRVNLEGVNIADMQEFNFPSSSYRKSSTHAGDDVLVFATGPMAHLFHSTHEQTHIANVMSYSACVGPFRELSARCRKRVHHMPDENKHVD